LEEEKKGQKRISGAYRTEIMSNTTPPGGKVVKRGSRWESREKKPGKVGLPQRSTRYILKRGGFTQVNKGPEREEKIRHSPKRGPERNIQLTTNKRRDKKD